jgi:type I restriction enzyme S subunit
VELKAGYKSTRVGVIPEDWTVEPLGRMATLRTGPFGSTLHESDYVEGGVPVINPMHIIDGRLEPTPGMTVSSATAARLYEFQVQPGDVVIGRRGDMGRCAVIEASQTGWLCGTGSMIVRSSSAHPGFLQRVLSSKRAIESIEATSVGSTMINLNQVTLSGLSVQFPPLEEQRAIATALSDVDSLLGALDRLIAKKRDLKQAAMQQLLTGQTRLPGFSGEWDIVEFGSVATIRNAKLISSSALLGTSCVELDGIESETGRLLRTTPALGGSAKYAFKAGDVLFGRLRAYLRKFWLATFDGLCSTEIWPLVPRDHRLCGPFLHFVVQTEAFVKAAAVAYGTHMPRSDWSVLAKLPLGRPALDEQIAIASALSDMDAEIEALEARRAKTRDIKQAMMQELLTGRTRLV